MKVQTFYHSPTGTLTYLLVQNDQAICIDPVADFDQAKSAVSLESVQEIITALKDKTLVGILETHVHADHLSGAIYLKEHFPDAKIGISQSITKVQELFAPIYDIDIAYDGHQFDTLFSPDDKITWGHFSFQALSTPGHTPACMSYLFEGHLFTGDCLFMPDAGTGRCDFPGGSATDLFESISKIYSLPQETKIYVGHDYMPGGRELAFQTTVAESASSNKHVQKTTSKEEFVNMRTSRDATLNAPKLLWPSIYINMQNAASIQGKEKSYLKTPLQLPGL